MVPASKSSLSLYFFMISVMFWNVQEAGSVSFKLSFYSLILSYKPSVVVLFERRISGKKADLFIKGNGFDRSHRVEAMGFTGGIWILWKNYLDIEVVFNHKQFIHFRVMNPNVMQSWVTVVYASLVSTTRREL